MPEHDLTPVTQLLNGVTKLDVRLYASDQTLITGQTQYRENPLVQPPDVAQIQALLAADTATTVLKYQTSFGLHYLALPVTQTDPASDTLILGPYLADGLPKQALVTNRWTISERKALTDYYQSLPILSSPETDQLGTLAFNLLQHPLATPHIRSAAPPVAAVPQPVPENTPAKRQQVAARYALQNHFMAAVTKGDIAAINADIPKMIGIFDVFKDRVPNSSLRALKNTAFVQNTSCRIAAERGGVHPLYLDSLSEKFAILIEQQNAIPPLKQLVITMAQEYGQLVRRFSTAAYSPLIRRCLDIIMTSLGHDLSLSQIAGQLNVNPAYLARQFKAATNQTVMTYIHTQRLQEAARYLTTTTLSVTDIAVLTGFNDLNYFTRLFKRHYHLPPSVYRQQPPDQYSHDNQ